MKQIKIDLTDEQMAAYQFTYRKPDGALATEKEVEIIVSNEVKGKADKIENIVLDAEWEKLSKDEKKAKLA